MIDVAGAMSGNPLTQTDGRTIARFQAQYEFGCPTKAWAIANPVGHAAWIHWRRENGLEEWPERFPAAVAP